MRTRSADIIVGLQSGDEGKGKTASNLAKSYGYNYVCRFSGGSNAGHTIYYEDRKIITHTLPCGILYKIPSIIGLGCVVNIPKFFNEIETLEKQGFDVKNYLFIDKRAHIVLPKHIEEDEKETDIGTTKQGIGPTYKDKYARTGLRAGDCSSELGQFLFDTYSIFSQKTCRILFEGAQGFELDIDWGDYPYVTSSHCTAGSAVMNGIPPQMIRRIYGVAKAYRTYVGSKEFETPSAVFERIRELGHEYGATTGRPRQIDWLDLDKLIVAANVNGVTDLVINKADILQDVQTFCLYYEGEQRIFPSFETFQEFVEEKMRFSCVYLRDITWSFSPYSI